MVFTQTATFEYNFHANQPFSLLTQYSYFQNFHPRIPTFDMMSHYVGAIPTYNYKSGRVWLPLSYNYVDVQSDKYFTGFLANPTWLHLLNEHVGVEATARFNRQILLDSPQLCRRTTVPAKTSAAVWAPIIFSRIRRAFSRPASAMITIPPPAPTGTAPATACCWPPFIRSPRS